MFDLTSIGRSRCLQSCPVLCISKEISHHSLSIFSSTFFALFNSTPKHVHAGFASTRATHTSLILTPGKPSLLVYLQCQAQAEDVASMCLTVRLMFSKYEIGWANLKGSLLAPAGLPDLIDSCRVVTSHTSSGTLTLLFSSALPLATFPRIVLLECLSSSVQTSHGQQKNKFNLPFLCPTAAHSVPRLY